MSWERTNHSFRSGSIPRFSPLLEQHEALAQASLRRKIASVTESVAATLETLLRRGDSQKNVQLNAQLASTRRILDAADDAIRSAREQALDWSSVRQQLTELILQHAALKAVTGDPRTAKSMDPVFHTAWEVLPQRGGMVGELVTALETALQTAVAGLRSQWPLADEPESVQSGPKPGGLPVPDLDRLHANSQKLRPWWARAMPALAVHAARARLESRFYDAIVACVDGYDRLLQSWAKREIERLAEHYEMEPHPFANRPGA